jgi:Ala-tRNA(Pro) deacylase
MATRRIQQFLSGNKVPFGTINHTCAYTAQEVAEFSHVPGRYMAKSVIVRIDGRLAIVVVPATKLVDLAKLRRETGAGEVRLAEEAEFRDEFDGCQLGTVPPFGNLFGFQTYLDRGLTQENHIAFNAGTHTDVFVVRCPDYIRLVQPRLLDVSMEPQAQLHIRKDKHPGHHAHKHIAVLPEDFLSGDPEVVQMECGCQILHHAGAD